MSPKWKLNSSKIGYSHPFFCVREDDVTLPNGINIPDYTVWESKNVAQVVPILPDGKIILVKQYKHGLGKDITECPGGFANDSEDPIESAKRELLEETGFESDDWINLGKFSHHPTKETGILNLFVAKKCRKSKHIVKSDESEILEVKTMTFIEIMNDINSGKVQQTGSIVAILLAKNNGYIKD